jgi:hypothetical protein
MLSGWKRTSQRQTSLLARNRGADAAMGNGSHRDARCERIRKIETRSAGSSAGRTNLKNLSKDLLLDNQLRDRPASLLGKGPNAATTRGRGRHKIARDGKERIRSAGKAAAQTNLNNLSRELHLQSRVMGRPNSRLGRKLHAATVRRSGVRKMVGRIAKKRKNLMDRVARGAARISRNPFKPLHRRGHQRPTARMPSQHASEVSAIAANKGQPRGLARAAGTQSSLTCSESRLTPQKNLLKTCSSVARAGRRSARSKEVARPQSAASPMFNSSNSAVTRKLKVRNPAARKASSKNRGATVRRKIRVTRKKAKASPKAARARTVEANNASHLSDPPS